MISVVIATSNRSKQLEQCLRHICNSKNPGVATELIVVDNNSSDNTKDVVTNFRDSSFCEITYVFEGKQGLSHARNRGICIAKYPLVVFTDDDCYVAKDWIVSIVREFTENPSLEILGGKVELANPGDQPLGIRSFSDRAPITSFCLVHSRMIGCNFACARKVFDAIDLFDPLLGAGSKSGSAEDTDFFYRGLKKGLKIAFVPEVLVFHAHGRQSSTAAQVAGDGYYRGKGAFYCKFILEGDRVVAKEAIREVWFLVKMIIRKKRVGGSRWFASRLLRQLLLGGGQRLFGR